MSLKSIAARKNWSTSQIVECTTQCPLVIYHVHVDVSYPVTHPICFCICNLYANYLGDQKKTINKLR